jgi:hypothetical protein
MGPPTGFFRARRSQVATLSLNRRSSINPHTLPTRGSVPLARSNKINNQVEDDGQECPSHMGRVIVGIHGLDLRRRRCQASW